MRNCEKNIKTHGCQIRITLTYLPSIKLSSDKLMAGLGALDAPPLNKPLMAFSDLLDHINSLFLFSKSLLIPHWYTWYNKFVGRSWNWMFSMLQVVCIIWLNWPSILLWYFPFLKVSNSGSFVFLSALKWDLLSKYEHVRLPVYCMKQTSDDKMADFSE